MMTHTHTHTPPAAVCNGLTICLPSEDSRTHMHAAGGVLSVKLIKMLARYLQMNSWSDSSVTYTSFAPQSLQRPLRVPCRMMTHNHQNGGLSF